MNTEYPNMTDNQTSELPTIEPSKPSFFSIPGNPNIPALVRAYGTIIRMANAVIIILHILALLGLAAYAPGIAMACILQIIISGILFFVGGLLREGKKAGVHAVSALAALEIMGGLILAGTAKQGGATIAMVVVLGVMIFLGPPIVVAYRHWEKFD